MITLRRSILGSEVVSLEPRLLAVLSIEFTFNRRGVTKPMKKILNESSLSLQRCAETVGEGMNDVRGAERCESPI